MNARATSTMDAELIHNPPPFGALAKLGFIYDLELLDPSGKPIDCERASNLYTLEGLNHMLGVELAGVAQIGAWYIGLFEGNYTPSSADTMALFPGNATESTAYQGTNRLVWTPNAASGGTINNYASKAAFTFSAPKTIYGGFIASGAVKGATAGVLLSVVRFASPKVVDVGSVINAGAGCTIVSA